ncbi:MAG: T9SS type A sorting domain-containing protein [Flavobacteriales bacterium]|nr:T9SS type A sorting domain-containing protein [Flavobacteriales bacterium]
MKILFAISVIFGTLICSAQSNLDFEKWDINYNGIDEAKYWINTSDATKYSAPSTLFKVVENPEHGLASIKLVTAYWELGASFQLDTLVGSLMQQSSYTKRPESFEFSYKANSKFGDEVLVGIQLTKTIKDSIIVIGEGFFTSNQQKENWTKEKIEVEYYSVGIPDNINIIAVSSANIVITNGKNGYAKIGSTLELDNFKLNLETKEGTNSDYFIHVFPNPAKEFINIETNTPEDQKIEIYNLAGKLELTFSFNTQTKIDISNLPSGIYIYKVFNLKTGEINASNKFNIIR